MDRIILLFDAHKLDISDEFSEVIKALKNHEDKIRVVLNKADQIETQQLMRVYGALMWSLGKIVNTPEVCTKVCQLGLEVTPSSLLAFFLIVFQTVDLDKSKVWPMFFGIILVFMMTNRTSFSISPDVD